MITIIRTHATSLLGSLCEIVVGILLLTNPVRFTSGIIIAVGVVLAALGVLSIIRYFRAEPLLAAREFALSKGLLLLAMGLFCMLFYRVFIATFPALTMIYGAGLLLVGFLRVQRAIDLLRIGRESWFLSAIGAAASLIIGAIILFNPFESTKLLWMLIGGALLLDAACDLLCTFFKKRSAM